MTGNGAMASPVKPGPPCTAAESLAHSRQISLLSKFSRPMSQAGLAAVTVARPLAQGLRLRAIERLPELERLRQRHAIGRWLRRCAPIGVGGGRAMSGVTQA